MNEKKEQKKKQRKNFWKALQMEIKEHKSSFLVYVVLRALVILCMVLQIFNQNYENVFLCALVLILFMVPSILQMELKIELPTTLEIIILLFIFAAEILGEIQEYYIKFPSWIRGFDSHHPLFSYPFLGIQPTAGFFALVCYTMVKN